MLYLLDKDVKTVKWNGIPLHEASSAIVKEEVNSDFTLTIRYPITDSGIYQLIKEDMLIKAPTPVLGAQLFRIKKPVENDDSLDITAYHISDDVMQRSINPLSVVGQGCAMALSQMVQNAKTDLGTFSFTSDIMDSRTFNTTDAETLYSVLLDGKHSIVGTWEGELVRDNFALTIKRSRGADRGVVITTHKNLKSYQRTKNSQSVVTRIHAKSTFKPDGAEDEVTLRVTVDSPLIGNYPYINEKDYENNNAKTVDELRKWAEAKFKNEGIDKVSDAIEIEAYELDGQVIHLGDTVNIKSRKHNVDIHKKAIAYEYNALTEEYISITFDDTPGVGGSGVSSGVSNAADVILEVNANAQEIAVERAIKNANQAFDAEFEKRVESINDGIEQAKAGAEAYADTIKQEISTRIEELDSQFQTNQQEQDRQIEESLRKAGTSTDLANVAKTIAESTQANIEQTRATLTNLVNQSTTKVNQMEQSVGTIRTDVASQARTLLAQAQAQTDLTNRVSTVETLADGTRSTVAELSRTVQEATQNIASVTSRTRTVEDTLSQTRTQYEALTQTVNTQTGQIESINRKTADLQSGIDGVTERFESLRIEDNLLLNSSFNENLNQWQGTGVTIADGKARIIGELNKTKYIYQSIKSQIANDDVSQVYIASISVKVTNYVAGSINPFLALYIDGRKNDSRNTQFGGTYLTANRLDAVNNRGVVQFATTFRINVPRNQIKLLDFHIYARDFTGEVEFEKVSLRRGDIDLGWQASPEDLRSEIATYKRTAEESSAELSRQIQLADGKAVEAKTFAQQTATAINTRLESLETYKDAEGTRASQYLSASRTETAKQITAERTVISANYVAKSTFEENARGVTQRFDSLQSYADAKIADYKNTVDGQFVNLQTQVNSKANQSDFQRIQTTSQLYERIIGSTESGIANNVTRMVMTDNAFVTEVSRVASNSELLARASNGLSITTNPTFDINTNGIGIYNNSRNGTVTVTKQSNVGSSQPNGQPHRIMISHTGTASPGLGGFQSPGWQYRANTEYAVDFVAMLPVGYRLDLASNYLGIGGEKKWLTPNIGTGKWERYVGYYKLGPNFGAYPLAYIFVSGPQPSTASPLTWYVQSFDILDISNSGSQALATRMTQLAGSWSVQNLNSSGDILSQANLSSAQFLLEAAKIRLKGKTLADEIQAIDGKFGTLFVADGTFAKLNATVIGSQAITADKLKVDQAFFDKLMANDAYLRHLFAKSAFITQVQAVTLSASKISGGLLTSLNGATTFDLNNGKLTFRSTSPSIEFNSSQSAIRRVSGGQSQFLKLDYVNGATYTTIGANRSANDESIGTADFTGLQIQSRSTASGGLIDKIYAYADEFTIAGGGGQYDGIVFKNRQYLYPQLSGVLDLGRSDKRWDNVYAFNYYVGQNAVSLRAFLDAVRACFQQIAYGGMTQTTYDLLKNKLSTTLNKI
ncbi:phage tail spike protein [Streptococcus suis]